MTIKFVIDSASDILPEEAAKLGVCHLPLTVSFGDESFRDSVDMTHREFFEKLGKSSVLPTTSQIPPSDFSDCFEKALAEADALVVITLSSALSGTYQSAMIAAEDYPGKVFVVDSRTVAIGERILLQRGLTLAGQGLDAAAIACQLDEEKTHIRLYAILDTLEYLKKGGRISSVTAIAGSVLSIKPAVTVADGVVSMAGKARGTRQGNALLRELIGTTGGIDFDRPLCMVWSGLEDSLLQNFIADNKDLWQDPENLPSASLGCTIGTHVGPGAYGIAYFEK